MGQMNRIQGPCTETAKSGRLEPKKLARRRREQKKVPMNTQHPVASADIPADHPRPMQMKISGTNPFVDATCALASSLRTLVARERAPHPRDDPRFWSELGDRTRTYQTHCPQMDDAQLRRTNDELLRDHLSPRERKRIVDALVALAHNEFLPALARLMDKPVPQSCSKIFSTYPECVAYLWAIDRRYDREAYSFFYDVLDHAVKTKCPDASFATASHVTPEDLVQSWKELSIQRFGPRALIYLYGWGVKSTDDIGELVHNLAAFDLVGLRPGETKARFHNHFDFERVFDPREMHIDVSAVRSGLHRPKRRRH
jgi:uncharacterized repeat protein (TIGR04138 family)